MSMIELKGVVRAGRIETEEPLDLPEGCEVAIIAYSPTDDEIRSPAEIARILAAMEQMEPFELTEEERKAADEWEKKTEKKSFEDWDKGIEHVFP